MHACMYIDLLQQPDTVLFDLLGGFYKCTRYVGRLVFIQICIHNMDLPAQS